MKKIFLLAVIFVVMDIVMAQTGNVGVGNNTPVTKLDVAGDLALREGTAIAVSGANPTVTVALTTANSENSFYRITGIPTGTMSINSIANGVDGQIITLVNATTIKLKITNNNVSSGILTPSALAQFISPNGTATLQYSTAASRWFITNSTGSNLTDWTVATTTDEPAEKTDNQYVTGNAGIGDFSTTTPAAKLDVIGNGLFRNGNTSTAFTKDQLLFGYSSGVNYKHAIKSRHNAGGTTGNSMDFYLWKQGADAATDVGTQQVMTLDGSNSGSVGIGTTAPYTKLDVVGNIYTTIHGNASQHNTTEIGTNYIGMKSGTTSDGFTGMKMDVGQYGSNGSGAFTNNGSRITFQTWGNSIAVSRDVMTINEFGEILGKFRQVTIHNVQVSSYYACSGSWPCDRFVWFPAPGDAGDDNEDNHTYQENIFIAPYSGRIVAIYLGTDNSSSNGGYEIQNARFIFNSTSGVMPEDGSLTATSTGSGTYTQLAAGSGTSFSGGRFSINEGARIVWKESRGKSTFSFGKGNSVAIGVSGDYIEDNNYQMTVVWEYNIDE